MRWRVKALEGFLVLGWRLEGLPDPIPGVPLAWQRRKAKGDWEDRLGGPSGPLSASPFNWRQRPRLDARPCLFEGRLVEAETREEAAEVFAASYKLRPELVVAHPAEEGDAGEFFNEFSAPLHVEGPCYIG